MRIILVGLFLIIFLILGLPYLGIQWIYSKINKEKSDLNCLHLVQWAFRVIASLSGVDLVLIGEENVPTDQAILYIGNHKSYFDIVLSYARCPRLTGYVAKNSMEKIPILSLFMKRLHCLFLNRDNPREGLKTILTGIEQIRNGISMCIYPEGTRNSTNELMLPFKEGSLKMAEKTNCAIIPMAITNSRAIFEDHFPFIKPAKVILEYGKPIYPKELSKEEQKFLGAHTQKVIREMLIKNQELI